MCNASIENSWVYQYIGNKLMQMNGATYTYDANGNIVIDGRRGLDLSWNHLNLPSSICSDEDEDALVNYTYLADGTKVITQQPATGEGYAYLGTMTYKRSGNSWVLESVPFTGGRFIANVTGGLDEYRYITDHLGSTRVIVTGTDYHEVEHDYYPFGMRIADNSLPTVATNRWRFSGKEIQTLGGINLIDFGARLYDEDAVKWKSQDPMADYYLALTPYGYCAGNPISTMDIDGMWFPILPPNEGIKAIGVTMENRSSSSTIKSLGFLLNSPNVALRVGTAHKWWPNSGISQTASNFNVNIRPILSPNNYGEGSNENAFRHALWQAILTREYGAEEANRIGLIHEEGILLPHPNDLDKTSLDTKVDLANNAIGRAIALENPGASNVELAKKVLSYFRNNDLNVIKNGMSSCHKISSEQYSAAMQIIEGKGENGLNKEENKKR